MTRAVIAVAFCISVLGASSVWARDWTPLIGPPPPKPPALEEPAPRYPLNYVDELAQRFGIEHGHMDVFSVAPDHEGSVVPTLKGGVDRNGAGIKLQWRMPK